MTRMAAAWRKAGFIRDDSPFAQATGEWERERADAADRFGHLPAAFMPRNSGEGSERSVLTAEPRDVLTHRLRVPGVPPTVHDELAGLVWRVFIAPATPVRVVMFCGADGQQPAGDVSAVAAELLAAHNVGSVCLVDSTGAVPSLHSRFAVSHAPRLAEASADLTSTGIERQVLNNLWLVASASSPVTGRDDRAISNERLGKVREQFDYVIVAAPPVLAGLEAMAIAAVVDGVILLIAENATRRDAAKMAIDSLQKSAAEILGVMLTNRSYPIPSAIYRRL